MRIVFWASQDCFLVDSLCKVETIHTDLYGTTFKKMKYTFHEKQLFLKMIVHDLRCDNHRIGERLPHFATLNCRLLGPYKYPVRCQHDDSDEAVMEACEAFCNRLL
jgi:hypothetical protein